MPAITESAKNEKDLSNMADAGDITVDEATMLVEEAMRPVDSIGTPITKTTKNNKDLTNVAENT